MKKQILDIVFASEKRKGTLLLLRERPREMAFLLSSLDTPRTALLPQIRVLEEHHLVSHEKDTYELTPIGNLIVDGMTPVLDTVNILDTDIDYWGTHRLDFIPAGLLRRINEIRSCAIVEPCVTELFELNRKYINDAYRSMSLHTVTTLLHPQFKDIYLDLVEHGVDIQLILSYGLFRKTRAENHADLKQLITNDKIRVFVYNKPMKLISFSSNDNSLLLRLLTVSGEYDGKQLILEGPNAVNWGKELFDHYLKGSIQVTEESMDSSF
ncbi:helix-turn-helix transcriptional regulator [Methanolobus chelungpuianus]|uniref:Methanogenesis regulatory protein FilR1 middle domain-containing protein n=1 Tax=Methanolobus chelungpuianus TaxID=502115 RepID=A0AAE3HBC4_9EURY|nr:winged helix-turn-helix domain-containing protein [Methanolobus chelungpuianus]MCQ6963542.1 hypothetical protein [Methanolobus chelungpuianus]